MCLSLKCLNLLVGWLALLRPCFCSESVSCALFLKKTLRTDRRLEQSRTRLEDRVPSLVDCFRIQSHIKKIVFFVEILENYQKILTSLLTVAYCSSVVCRACADEPSILGHAGATMLTRI